MDLLKAPSIQSLLDSDIESIASLQSLDIEELDEEEYALPHSEVPTLAEALSEDDGDTHFAEKIIKEPIACAALQAEVLQAVSQQLTQAQERTQVGGTTTLSAGPDGRLSVGTSHGKLLTFVDQVLRWVCDNNTDSGAVSSLAYSSDGSRLLAGFARGIVCQYETTHGDILRRVTLGGELWGVLQVVWAGATGLALDTGGSVWLMKFSRPLGVRSSRTSCLFSGARGEVVAMAARDARVLALATLARVIVVAGGRAAGVKIGGSPHTLPVLAWAGADERVLVSARDTHMQFLAAIVTPNSVSLKPLQKYELKASPLWLGWLGNGLAIFDSNEKLFLWGNDGEKPLDLSDIEPVYATAFFKGLWTDGRVSRGMWSAGASALGGVSVTSDAWLLLGRRGVLRVKLRDSLARSRALYYSDRQAQALTLLCTTQGVEALSLAQEFLGYVSEKPSLVANKEIAKNIIKLCVKFELKEDLWGQLWESCLHCDEFVEAVAEAAARGELAGVEPSPDVTQILVERLAEVAPSLLERVLISFPLTALDPHRCSMLARERGLWRAYGALAAALGGTIGAMRELCDYVRTDCGESCRCAGDALLLCAADGLAGRAAGGAALPGHARPAARHDALQALLGRRQPSDSPSPLHVLVRHDPRALVRLLEQSARDPPFVGPLGKQNRLRVARELLTAGAMNEEHLDILEFVTTQIVSGSLPCDVSILITLIEFAASVASPRSDRALVSLLTRNTAREQIIQRVSEPRPRLAYKLHSYDNKPNLALEQFFQIENLDETDIDDLFSYVHTLIVDEKVAEIKDYVLLIAELRPRAAATVLLKHYPESLPTIFENATDKCNVIIGEYLLEMGHLTGKLATIYLRCLCSINPESVVLFLSSNPGIVRPEDALAIVKNCGLKTAEPYCLEAVGDSEAALEAILALDKDEDCIRAACELCARVTRSAPASVAAAMWAKVITSSERVPAAVLAEAAAYLPGDVVLSRCATNAREATSILSCARNRQHLWHDAAQICYRELHETLARALITANKSKLNEISRGFTTGVIVCACGEVRSSDTSVEWCGGCGTTPPQPRAVCTVPNKEVSETPLPFNLVLVAPPRPDLEGIV